MTKHRIIQLTEDWRAASEFKNHALLIQNLEDKAWFTRATCIDRFSLFQALYKFNLHLPDCTCNFLANWVEELSTSGTSQRKERSASIMALKKFMIERDIAGVGAITRDQLSGAAATSNEALCKIGAADIQWVESYMADDKTFCVYLATDESAIRKHAEISGFPATKITEIKGTIDPATAK